MTRRRERTEQPEGAEAPLGWAEQPLGANNDSRFVRPGRKDAYEIIGFSTGVRISGKVGLEAEKNFRSSRCITLKSKSLCDRKPTRGGWLAVEKAQTLSSVEGL
ncbi:hypothetical protein U9M48_020149, partial [Paspalum notatum var. saurae]